MTVIYEVPALIDTVIAAQAGGPLLASSSTLRLLVQQRMAAITLKGQPSFCTFVSQSWQSLSLECGSLGTDSMALLATAALPGLTSLSLRANALDHQSMSILVKSHFPKLLILDLSHNRLDLSAMRYFITGKWSLRSVNLSHNQLNSAAVKALTQAPSKCLDTLDVSCNEIDAGGIAALGQAKWRQLKHLRVSISHQDTTFALESLGKADFPVLQSLDLQSSWLQHQTVGQLSRLHQLTALNLSNSQLTWDCVRDLVQTAWGRKLQQLNFSRNKLGWIFTVDLIQADWANLQVLDLSWTGLGSEDNEIFSSCEYLCQGKWPLLRSLLLAGNGLTVDGIEDLTKGNWPLLQTLDLSSNFLTPHAVSQLTEASWPQLQELRLATNSFCMRDSYLADILSLAEPPLRPGCNCIVAPHTVAGGCWPQLQLLDLSG